MSTSLLVTDTHPLVWYLGNQHKKLSRMALDAFHQAVEGSRAIWVPVPVLWEIAGLVRLGRIQLRHSLADYVEQHFFARGIHLCDLVAQDVLYYQNLAFNGDPFDEMIVSMALRLDCPLITRDAAILDARPCEVFWD